MIAVLMGEDGVSDRRAARIRHKAGELARTRRRKHQLWKGRERKKKIQ